MEGVRSGFTSAEWWLTVFVAGVFINLLASYLKPRVDGFLSHVSSRRRAARGKQRSERQAEVERLRSSQHEQTMSALYVVKLSLRTQFFLINCVGYMVVGVVGVGTALLGEPSLANLLFVIFTLVAALLSFSWTASSLRATHEAESVLADAIRSAESETERPDQQYDEGRQATGDLPSDT